MNISVDPPTRYAGVSVPYASLCLAVLTLCIQAAAHQTPQGARVTRADYVWAVTNAANIPVAGLDGAGVMQIQGGVYEGRPAHELAALAQAPHALARLGEADAPLLVVAREGARHHLYLRGQALVTDAAPRQPYAHTFAGDDQRLAGLDAAGNLWVRGLRDHQRLGLIDEPVLTRVGVPAGAPAAAGLLGVPVKLAFVPDDPDTVFLSTLGGRIQAVHIPSRTARPFVDWSQLGEAHALFSRGFQGLQGIAFHPGFGDAGGNNHLYAYYTHANTTPVDTAGLPQGASVEHRHNRLHRFTVARDKEGYHWSAHHDLPDNDAPLEIYSSNVVHGATDPWLQDSGWHQGGHLAFGEDAQDRPMLYLSTGDAGQDPWETKLYAQDATHSAGKLLRLDEQGRPAPDNPIGMADGHGAGGFVVAKGLRNPFVLCFVPGTNDVFIGDVGSEDGGAALEEINFVPARAERVRNFGWPRLEGSPHHPSSNVPQAWETVRQRLPQATSRSAAPAALQQALQGEIEAPVLAYAHAAQAEPLDAPADKGCVAGCAILPPSAQRMPADLRDALLFVDYAKNIFGRVALADTGTPRSVEAVNELVWHRSPLPNPTQLLAGPDGSLYYLSMAHGGALRRIRVPGPQEAPVAISTVEWARDPLSPERRFRGDHSFDTLGRSVTFAWDLGDGQTSSLANPTHVYDAPGEYVVQLTVTAPNGLAAVAEPLRVAPGMPGVALESPQALLLARGLLFGAPQHWSAIAQRPDARSVHVTQRGDDFHATLARETLRDAPLLVVRITSRGEEHPIFYCVLEADMGAGWARLSESATAHGPAVNEMRFQAAVPDAPGRYRVVANAINAPGNQTRQVLQLEVGP